MLGHGTDAPHRLRSQARLEALHQRRALLRLLGGIGEKGEVLGRERPDLVGGKVPEGVASREQIQAMIDANPAGFRSSAASMEQQAKALAAAAGKRDIKTAGGLISTFDQACQGCHQNYWYLKE
jgi:hypothetical protein